MPLQIIKDGKNLDSPRIFCDACHKEIKTAADGNYEWRVDEKGKPAGGIIQFSHNGPCSHALREKEGGQSGWHSQKLDLLPGFLKASLKVDQKKVEEKLRLDSQF